MAYLVPRDPFNITSLRRQMDDMFDNLFPGSGLAALKTGAGVMVDVLDQGNDYVVKANVPGFTARDVEVRVGDEGVTIKGVYNEEKEDKTQNYLVRERRSGSFLRTIPLQNINPDGAKAKFKDGVLELTVPKQDPVKRLGRQLEIEE
jgi:HSP20 family protein